MMPERNREIGARVRVAFLTAITGAVLLVSSRPADAHTIGLSRGEYRVTEQGMDVTIVLAQAEMLAVVPALARGAAGPIDAASLASARADLERATIDRIRVTTQGAGCAGALVDASLTERDGLAVEARYECPIGAERLTVTLPLLDDLSHGHRHAAEIVAGGERQEHLLFRGAASFAVDRGARGQNAAVAPRSLGFVRMGIEHILTGYDHLLFLFALVLAGGPIRALAMATTAFTVAHSLTLAVTAFGIVSPPARLVEPAIALSIAYVGIENLVARRSSRCRSTFLFGLLHGFGFAGALGAVALPSAQVPGALLSFNVGVELGQLAWMAVLVLLFAELRRYEWFARRAVPLLSGAVVILGCVWFVGRIEAPSLDVGHATHARPWRG
jgi:hydrogenase/urease accessory protein HupE